MAKHLSEAKKKALKQLAVVPSADFITMRGVGVTAPTLANLAKDGLVERTEPAKNRPHWSITEAGRNALDGGDDEEGN